LAAFRPFAIIMTRTHHCAQLTKADLGAIVSLAG